MKSFTLFTLILLFSVGQIFSYTIKVPADQPTIQSGIDAASDYDTVLVDPGTWVQGNLPISQEQSLMEITPVVRFPLPGEKIQQLFYVVSPFRTDWL